MTHSILDQHMWYGLDGEQATNAFGSLLARHIVFPGVIFLYGQLGAGKTTLVRAMLRELGYSGLVKSPTYTLVEEYVLNQGRLLHFDLYRLSDPEELEYMGIRDYFAGEALCVLEWPEKGVGALPVPDLEIHLQVAEPGRRVKLTGSSEVMRKAVTSIEQQFAANAIA